MSKTGRGGRIGLILVGLGVLALAAVTVRAQESPYLYGIHDHDTGQQEYLNRLNAQGVTGWVTATLGIGSDPNNHSGGDFRSISDQGHTVIARLNNGYGSTGTIPVPAQYANFAQRCANYVAASQGCNIWLIGNETNLASEWPAVGGYRNYISPQSYADCFRLCYNAIKAVRPNAKVLCQALAPWAGPYGAGADHDAMPLGWTAYMHQMLTAIGASGGLDGIAVHINSRGYTYNDVHSTAKVNGQYFSFYVYQDWVNLGTPAHLRTLPYYATECNGAWYWKGGHAECGSCANPSCCYQPGWMQWIHEEINAWNQSRAASGEGIYRCLNMYRWCSWCDGWNIDGTPQKGQILADLDAVAAQKYRWDTGPVPPPTADFTGTPTSGQAPLAVSFTDLSSGNITSRAWEFGDGGTSTAVNPTHTYLAEGTYTVRLTASGPGGSHTRTRTNYIQVSAPVPGSNLISNGTFDTNLTGWTAWTERNTAGDFSASVASGQLRTTGSNYNGGVWQQFATGGAGRVIDVTGFWQSNPTVAEYQWAEVRIINGPRTPVNGQDEGAQPDSVLVYKNDTWGTPGGWNGTMSATAPVASVSRFTSAGNLATIVLKSGNLGGTSSGVRWDNLEVRDANRPPVAAVQASPLTGDAPLIVHFDASASHDPDSDPLNFAWSFGDGQVGSGAVLDHTYTSPGTYTAAVTVSDGRGGTDSVGVQINVTGDAPAVIIIESRSGGQNHAWYREEGTWADISSTSTAPGVTASLGSRYGSTYRSVAGLKAAVFEPVIPSPGQYRVYATWPTHSLTRNPIFYRITHADGVAELDVDQTQNANTWFDLGEYRLTAGSGTAVRLSNEHTDESGSMFASAVRFVQVSLTPQQYSRADFDRDGDVDLDDYAHLQLCLSGVAVPQNEAACTNARLDAGDNDVDHADVALFRTCLSGADIDADVDCP